MRAGRLRHRISIEYPSEVTDSFGGVSTSWVEHESRWAEVVPLTGKPLTSAQQIHAESTHRVRIRHLELEPSFRLKFGNLILEPLHTSDIDNLGRELVILCRSGVNHSVSRGLG